MNKARRKRLEEVVGQLMDLQTEVEEIRDEEQEAYDNMPESLQDSERGESMSEIIDILDGLDFESIISDINDCIE